MSGEDFGAEGGGADFQGGGEFGQSRWGENGMELDGCEGQKTMGGGWG